MCLADVSAVNQNEAVAAFNAVDALARQTRAQGDLPRWLNPEHAKVLARFWNVETTFGTPPYRSSDVPALIAISGRAAVVEEINRALPGLSGTARQKALTIKAAFERGGCEGLCTVEAQ